ncbi:Uncharacterized membrane-anchored protein YjiN, DUF445 family [Clostridium cavendishii DSM 21758]|uniref:Uncharacterized membrane-anchored protein YjiN, DUF445 family n=1 Tax=Clostridium cavendishii DSM 21758 TaxID=1121302 RepID=A0A1M6HL87_9CLOT|nr:DUF445 domain-containing protein [Clostridium cavendishii]SHJ22968.1 Uncharacterized membrane-anchored protein YjiN, DUF445 family [Clostridium cavendishii DSM 21758]
MERNISNVGRKNSNIATWILLIFSVIFFISYPFHDSFVGGLISSLCCAAMIGGLADWFAVVALFRKPLNSNILARLFRTEIIPKNRDRIFEALVDMVEKELLTKESIMNKLGSINPSKAIIELTKADKKQELLVILNNIFNEILNSLSEQDLHNIESLSNEILKSNLKSIELSKVISQSLEWMWNNGYKEKITDIIVDKIEELSKTYESKMLLQDAVLQILELNRGSFLIMIIGFFIKGNLENIARIVQEKLVNFVAQMKSPENSEREKIQLFIVKQINRLNEDEELKNVVETWKNEKLEVNQDMFNELSLAIKSYILSLKSDDAKTFETIENLLGKLENNIESFKNDEEKQIKVNNTIKGLIEKLVEKNHHKIGLIVQEKLNEVSGEELSNMIEPIIGEDLQLIRVNGSLVGGLVGVITYILTFWIV